jgi:predicted aspartyl protease
MNSNTCDFIKFKLDIGRDEELYFLLDTGADVSIIKSEKLIGSTEFEPREKIKLKSVDGSIVETHGSVTAKIIEGNTTIPFTFQLVDKQVDINGDGIIGRDLLQKMQARICYESKILELRDQNFSILKTLLNRNQVEQRKLEKGLHEEVRTLTLPSRSETLVRIKVESEENQTEGLI